MTFAEIVGQFIAPAVLGLGGGIVGQWLGWRLEKRRVLLQRRGALIDRWRNELSAAVPPERDNEDNRPPYWVLETPVYQSLRPHLPDEFIRRVEAPRTLFVGVGDDFPREGLLAQVDRIEREWGLV